jgi:hypothetical protein
MTFQDYLFRGTIVIVLGIGALSPVTRGDGAADYVGVVSSVILTGLAMKAVLRPKSGKGR